MDRLFRERRRRRRGSGGGEGKKGGRGKKQKLTFLMLLFFFTSKGFTQKHHHRLLSRRELRKGKEQHRFEREHREGSRRRRRDWKPKKFARTKIKNRELGNRFSSTAGGERSGKRARFSSSSPLPSRPSSALPTFSSTPSSPFSPPPR